MGFEMSGFGFSKQNESIKLYKLETKKFCVKCLTKVLKKLRRRRILFFNALIRQDKRKSVEGEKKSSQLLHYSSAAINKRNPRGVIYLEAEQ